MDERAATAAMIAVEGLRKTLRTGVRELEILKGISFSVPRGEFVAIMGASGSGKSTLLGLLAGLDTPTAGEVRLNGTAISYLKEDRLAEIRGRTLGFVFQAYQLIPTLTALENVLLPTELNASRAEARGGVERARELARAFALRPPIVLADEPTGNLDSVNGQQVLRLLVDLNEREGTTLVLVTHDAAVAELAHRRITLRDGAVVGDERRARGVAMAGAAAAAPLR